MEVIDESHSRLQTWKRSYIPVSVAGPDMHGLLALHYELMVSAMSPSHLARLAFLLSP